MIKLISQISKDEAAAIVLLDFLPLFLLHGWTFMFCRHPQKSRVLLKAR